MTFFFEQETLAAELAAVKTAIFLPAYRRELIALIDLTRLNETDTTESIATFCQKAVTPYGKVAALCVYPLFVKQIAAFLKGSGIRVSTVANFPEGSSPLAGVLQEIERAVEDGAEEVDVVFPYTAYLRGEHEAALSFVSCCKTACAPLSLKVILETGAFTNLDQIAQVAEGVIQAGADFIKTSTGKRARGASLEAAAVILLVIKKALLHIKRPLGFKAAGGICEPEQALQYLLLAKNILGPSWPTSQTFRLGASQLLNKLI